MSNARVREYRDWLERNGRDTGLTSDTELAIELGREAERRGLSVEAKLGSEFNDYYLDIKNRKERPLLHDVALAFKKQWHGQRASALEGAATIWGGHYEDALRERAAEQRKKAAETPTPSIERPSDVRWNRPGEALRGLVTGVGSAAPSLIDVGASAAIGGMAGRAITTGSLANQGIRNSIAKSAKLARKRGKDFSIPSSASINAMAKSKEASIAAGVFMGTGVFTQLTGEVMHELEGLTQLDPSHPDYLDKDSARNIAMGFGAVAAIPDTILPGMVINKVMNRQAKHLVRRESQGEFKDYMRKSLLYNMAGGIGIEAGTEAFQEYLIMGAERFARGEDWALNPQEQKRLIDGAILGGIGGGMFGAVSTTTDLVSEADKRKHEEAKRAEVEEANRIIKEALEEKRREDRAQFEILDEIAKQLGEQLGTEDAVVGDTVETPEGETGEVVAVEGDNVEIQTDDGDVVEVPQADAYVKPPLLQTPPIDSFISAEINKALSFGQITGKDAGGKTIKVSPEFFKADESLGVLPDVMEGIPDELKPIDRKVVEEGGEEGTFVVAYKVGQNQYRTTKVKREAPTNDIGSAQKFVAVPDAQGEIQQITERSSITEGINADIGDYIGMALAEAEDGDTHMTVYRRLLENISETYRNAGRKSQGGLRKKITDTLKLLKYIEVDESGNFKRFAADLPKEASKKKAAAAKEAREQADDRRRSHAESVIESTGLRENNIFSDRDGHLFLFRSYSRRNGRISASRITRKEDGTLEEDTNRTWMDPSRIEYVLTEVDAQAYVSEQSKVAEDEDLVNLRGVFEQAEAKDNPVTKAKYNQLINKGRREREAPKPSSTRKGRGGFRKKVAKDYTGDGAETGTVRLKTGANWSIEHGEEGKSIMDALRELPPATIKAIRDKLGEEIQIQIGGETYKARVEEGAHDPLALALQGWEDAQARIKKVAEGKPLPEEYENSVFANLLDVVENVWISEAYDDAGEVVRDQGFPEEKSRPPGTGTASVEWYNQAIQQLEGTIDAKGFWEEYDKARVSEERTTEEARGLKVVVGNISIPVGQAGPSTTLQASQAELYQPESQEQLSVQSSSGEVVLKPATTEGAQQKYIKLEDGQEGIAQLLLEIKTQKFKGITLAKADSAKRIAVVVEGEDGKIHVLGIKKDNVSHRIKIVRPEQNVYGSQTQYDLGYAFPPGYYTAQGYSQISQIFEQYTPTEQEKLAFPTPDGQVDMEGKYRPIGVFYSTSTDKPIRLTFNNLGEFENAIGNTPTEELDPVGKTKRTKDGEGRTGDISLTDDDGNQIDIQEQEVEGTTGIIQLINDHFNDEISKYIGDLEGVDYERQDWDDADIANKQEIATRIAQDLRTGGSEATDVEGAFAEKFNIEQQEVATDLTLRNQLLTWLSDFYGDTPNSGESAKRLMDSLSELHKEILADIFSAGTGDDILTGLLEESNPWSTDSAAQEYRSVAEKLYGIWYESSQDKLKEWLDRRKKGESVRTLPTFLNATSSKSLAGYGGSTTPSNERAPAGDAELKKLIKEKLKEVDPSQGMTGMEQWEIDRRTDMAAELNSYLTADLDAGVINVLLGDIDRSLQEIDAQKNTEQVDSDYADDSMNPEGDTDELGSDALPMRVYHSTDRVFNKHVEFFNVETGESLQAVEMVEFRNPLGAFKAVPKELLDGFRAGQVKLRVKDMFDLSKVGSGLGSQSRGFGVYVSTGDEVRRGYFDAFHQKQVELRLRPRGEDGSPDIGLPVPGDVDNESWQSVFQSRDAILTSPDDFVTKPPRGWTLDLSNESELLGYSLVSLDGTTVLEDQLTFGKLREHILDQRGSASEYTGTIPDDGFVIDDIPVRYQSDMVKNAMLAVNAEIRNLAKNIEWADDTNLSSFDSINEFGEVVNAFSREYGDMTRVSDGIRLSQGGGGISRRSYHFGNSAAKTLDDIFLFIEQEISSGDGAATLFALSKLGDQIRPFTTLDAIGFNTSGDPVMSISRVVSDLISLVRRDGEEVLDKRLRLGESPNGEQLRNFYQRILYLIMDPVQGLTTEQQVRELRIVPEAYANLITKHGLHGFAHADRYSRVNASNWGSGDPNAKKWNEVSEGRTAKDLLKPRELGGEIDYNYVITNPKVVKDLERIAMERAEEAVEQQLNSEDTIRDFIGAADASLPFGVNAAIDRIKEFMAENGIEDEITTRLLNRMRGDSKLDGVKIRFLSEEELRAPENSHILQDFEASDGGVSTAALWYMGANVIYIPSFLNVTPEQLVHTLTHEIFHPFLFRHLELGSVAELAGVDNHFGGTEHGRAAINAHLEGADQVIEIERAYRLLKKIFKESKQSLPAEQWFNGLLSMDEFTNDILNNREFQKYLATVELSDELKRELGLSKEERGLVRTLWDAIVQLINRLFNATEGTALAEGLDQLKVILHASDSYMIPRQMIEGEAGGYHVSGPESRMERFVGRDPGSSYEALGVPRVTEQLLESVTYAQIDMLDAVEAEAVEPSESEVTEALNSIANRVLRQTQETPLEVRHGSDMSPEDLQAAYELFRRAYEEATGSAFTYDEFTLRARNWTFIGNERGYVAVREQKGGLLKLVGSAGDKRLVFRAMQSLIDGEAPVWGAVTEDIKEMSARIGMYTLSTPGAAALIRGLAKFMRSLPIQSINDNGSVTVNTPSGPQDKYLIGNRAYLDMMENNPPIKIPFSGSVMKKVMGSIRRQTDAPMRMQVQAQRKIDANMRMRRAGEAAGANTFLQAVEVAFRAIKAKRPDLERETFNQMLGLDKRHASAKILNQVRKDDNSVIDSTLRDGPMPQRKMAAELALRLIEKAREKARNRIESIEQKLSEDGDFLSNSESEFALLRTNPKELVTEASVGSRLQLQLRRRLAALKKREHDSRELSDELPDSLNADENNAHDIYKKLMELNDVQVDKLGKLVSSLVGNKYFGSKKDMKETRVGVSMLDAGMGENELQAKFIHDLMGGAEAKKAYRLYEAGAKGSFSDDMRMMVSLLDNIKDTENKDAHKKDLQAVLRGTSVTHLAINYANQYFMWLDVKNKNPELVKEKEDLTVFDSVLYPTSIRLRQGLGDLEKFEMTHNAKMLAMKKNADGSWNLDHKEPYTVKFSSSGQLEDRSGLKTQVMLNHEFINDAGNVNKYGDTLWFDMLKQQTEATMKAVTASEWTESKMFRLSSILHSIESKASKLGYMGKSIAGMMSQSRQILMEELPKAELLGKRWERALMELSRHFDIPTTAIKTDIYHQAIKWIEDHPEYYENETALFNNLWLHLKSRGAGGRSKYNASGKKLMIQLMRRTKDSLDYESVLARRLGNKVRDAKIIVEADEDGGVELRSRTKNKSGTWVQSLYDPEVMVPLSRDPIERGWLTASRRLRSHTLSVLSETMGKQLAWDGLLIRINEELAPKLDQIDDEKQRVQEAVKFLSAYMPDGVVDEFIEPYATSTSPIELFSTREDRLGLSTKISQSQVSHMWSAARGDTGIKKYVNFVVRLYDSEPKDGEAQSLSDYLIDVTKLLYKQYSRLQDHARKATGENELGMADAMAHRMMDSRDIRTMIPERFFEYDSYDAISMKLHLGMISANAAFGRDASVMEAHMKSIGGSVARRTAQYINYVQAALGDHRIDPAAKKRVKLKKGERERVVGEISRHLGRSTAESEKYLKSLELGIDSNGALRGLRGNLREYFQGQDGPFRDFKLAYELIGMHAFMMLNQPKSGLINLLSIKSFPAVFKGANAMSVKATWGAVLEVANQTLGGIIEALGMEAWQTSEYGEYLNDMFFRTTGEDLDLQDYMLNTGIGGSGGSSLENKLQMATRSYRDFKRYTPSGMAVKDRKRKPVHLKTLIPLIGTPFSYFGEIANHSIAVGTVKAYEYLVRKAAEFIETAKPQLDYEITGNDIGFDRQKLSEKLFFGGEEGFDFMQEKLAEHGLPSVTQLARDYIARRKNGDERIITKDAAVGMAMISMNEVSLEGPGAKPAWMYDSKFRWFSPLLGWSFAATRQTGKAWQSPEGNFSKMALLKWFAIMAAMELPLTMAFMFLMDWYDEDAAGKTTSLPKVSPVNIIPGVAAWNIAFSDKRTHLIERAARAGIGGIAGEIGAAFVTQADPTRGARPLSVDSRVVVVSMYNNLFNQLGPNILRMHGGGPAHTLGFNLEYNEIIRPALYMMGANGALHTAQILTNLLEPIEVPILEQERQVADYIGIRAAIRSAAVIEGHDLRDINFSGYKPGLSTAFTRDLLRKAIADDADGFERTYKRAIEEAKRKGEADPEKYVYDSFKSRNLRQNIIDGVGKIDDETWMGMLETMSPRTRAKVQSAELMYNTYLRRLEPDEYISPYKLRRSAERKARRTINELRRNQSMQMFSE